MVAGAASKGVTWREMCCESGGDAQTVEKTRSTMVKEAQSGSCDGIARARAVLLKAEARRGRRRKHNLGWQSKVEAPTLVVVRLSYEVCEVE